MARNASESINDGFAARQERTRRKCSGERADRQAAAKPSVRAIVGADNRSVFYTQTDRQTDREILSAGRTDRRRAARPPPTLLYMYIRLCNERKVAGDWRGKAPGDGVAANYGDVHCGRYVGLIQPNPSH